jgi:hypothetical protein
MNRTNNEIVKSHVRGAKLCKTLYNIPNKNTLVKYNKKRKDLYVVLQGTNSIFHWVHNVSFIPTKEEGVHSGFKNFAKLCKKELLCDLENIVNTENVCYDDIEHIYFTSHSLGGSATVILLYEMMKKKELHNMLLEKHVDIVLFGAPKSGNDVFTENFKELFRLHDNITIYRYNMKYDFIKYYPPVLMYSHVSDDIILTNEDLKIQHIVYNHSINCYIKYLDVYYF